MKIKDEKVQVIKREWSFYRYGNEYEIKWVKNGINYRFFLALHDGMFDYCHLDKTKDGITEQTFISVNDEGEMFLSTEDVISAPADSSDFSPPKMILADSNKIIQALLEIIKTIGITI